MDISEGQIFWKNMEGSINSLVSAGKVLEANGTYTIAVKIKPYFTYLFSDGTTGLLHKNPGKTPVGVVVDPVNHLAAAIEEVGNGTKYKFAVEKYRSVPTSTVQVSTSDLTIDANKYLAQFATSGFDETWNASYTSSNVTGDKVKGNNPDFPAFYAAGRFRPSVALSGSLASKKWFLPSQQDYFHAYDLLGFAQDIMSIGSLTQRYRWYGYLFEKAFTDAGGKSFMTTELDGYYWTSTAHSGGSRFWPIARELYFPTNFSPFEYKVRAFVLY
jgi:hypothetical protein